MQDPKISPELKKLIQSDGAFKFCFSCMKQIVTFPHQCSEIFKNVGHDWQVCEIHAWHSSLKKEATNLVCGVETGLWVKCKRCTWHIPSERLADVARCPSSSPSPFSDDMYRTGLEKKGDRKPPSPY